VRAEGEWRAPDESALQHAVAEAEKPFRHAAGDIEQVREALLDCMWEDVGIVRSEAGLARAARRLAELDDQLNTTGMASDDRAFNLTWHDWLNLSNLILVSRAIQSAATERRESRGAHFREDFPERGPLEQSSYVTVRLKDGTADQFELGEQPVKFSIIRPGESLLTR
jgi:fumarate reductase flavoprotein subunit